MQQSNVVFNGLFFYYQDSPSHVFEPWSLNIRWRLKYKVETEGDPALQPLLQGEMAKELMGRISFFVNFE